MTALPIPRESELHAAVADFFRAALPPATIWLHVPNGEKRDKATAARLVKFGVLPGAADFFLFHEGRPYMLELKRQRGGRFSPEQLEFARRCERQGIPVAVARSIDDVIATLRRWGIPVRARLAA